jgi:hypothetical protein
MTGSPVTPAQMLKIRVLIYCRAYRAVNVVIVFSHKLRMFLFQVFHEMKNIIKDVSSLNVFPVKVVYDIIHLERLVTNSVFQFIPSLSRDHFSPFLIILQAGYASLSENLSTSLHSYL